MLLTEDTFCKIIQDTWSSILGLLVDFPAGPTTASAENFKVQVNVSGAWNGEVRLSCPPNLARLVAAAFFQVDAEQSGRDQIVDALSEIVHIIGGNLKSLLPQPVTLSLPSVHNSDDSSEDAVESERIWSIVLASRGYPFQVSLFGKASSGTLPQPEEIQPLRENSLQS